MNLNEIYDNTNSDEAIDLMKTVQTELVGKLKPLPNSKNLTFFKPISNHSWSDKKIKNRRSMASQRLKSS